MTEHPNQAFTENQNAVEQSNSTGGHKLRVAMKSVAAYSILATALGTGAILASVFWSSSNASLQSELRRNQEEIARLRDELAYYRGELSSKRGDIGISAGWVRVKVFVGSTAFVFDDQLSISLIATQFAGNPARYRVTALVAASDATVMKMANADVGYTVTFPPGSKTVFEIQLVEVDAISAGFLVRRLNG